MIFKPNYNDMMDSDFLRIIKIFNDNLDLDSLHKIIDSLKLKNEYYLVIYNLNENRFDYFNASNNKMFRDIPNQYLDKGFQYLQEICHPNDFAKLVKEIANEVYSNMNNKTIMKSINGGQILRVRNKKGEWLSRKIHLIYLKECNKRMYNVLLGFIHRDTMILGNDNFKITAREKQVFKFLSKGFSAKMIGETLNISENTVITHRKNLIQKLNVKNSAELIKKGFELSLIY